MSEAGDTFEEAEIEAPQFDVEIEAEARRGGWRPLDEYRGDPSKWVDAKTFVENGQRILPVVRRERDELRDTVSRMAANQSQLSEELAAARADMQKLLASHRTAEARGRAQALAELRNEQRQAVVEADTARFDAASEQINRLESEEIVDEPALAPVTRPAPRPAVQLDPAVQEFVDSNPWYSQDRTLNTAMVAEHQAIAEEFPGMEVAQQLAMAKAAVIKRFPKKFGIPQTPPAQPPKRPASPMPPTDRDPPPRAKTGFEQIADPKARREAEIGYERLKRSMPDIKPNEYIAIYLDPHADVLDVMEENQTTRKARANGKL